MIEALNKQTKRGSVKKLAKEENETVSEGEEDVAVVLIGHGSKLPYGKEVMEEFGRRVEMRGIFKAVRVAFMQLNSPSIEEALRELAKAGMTNIVAQPVFLADGAHTTEDIPEKLKESFEGAWAELGKGVKLIYAKPIGVDERIVDILLDRIKEATGK
uniref:Sirohydrochlorin cobaltochelatase n=1 Tax=Candidatus Methanophagaceae archaeon ANME-1 ERB6 TaxID=2759912 RepID=A0A7G9YTS3_9EURY|nr:sirohydrochlorin cobaltochelatase [Methanosarcinales archaeon ANME-1 ERB6]